MYKLYKIILTTEENWISPLEVNNINFRFAAFLFIFYSETQTPVFASCWLSFWWIKTNNQKKKGKPQNPSTFLLPLFPLVYADIP